METRSGPVSDCIRVGNRYFGTIWTTEPTKVKSARFICLIDDCAILTIHIRRDTGECHVRRSVIHSQRADGQRIRVGLGHQLAVTEDTLTWI